MSREHSRYFNVGSEDCVIIRVDTCVGHWVKQEYIKCMGSRTFLKNLDVPKVREVK